MQQPVKENDPRLVEIANWRNHATENECTWIRYIWAWYDRQIVEPLRRAEMSKANFAAFCSSHEIFTVVTSGQEERSEDEMREKQEESEGWIDPSTGKPYVRPPEPVGPFLDEHGVFRNAPPLSGRSRKKVVEILPAMIELWEKRVLDAFLNHRRLKRCPECKKWFVISKTDQTFCQTPARDRAINPRTGNPRPVCRIVAYQRTEEYKEKTRKKMANWRVAKKAKAARSTGKSQSKT
jgi:hypothetical protein